MDHMEHTFFENDSRPLWPENLLAARNIMLAWHGTMGQEIKSLPNAASGRNQRRLDLRSDPVGTRLDLRSDPVGTESQPTKMHARCANFMTDHSNARGEP
ncbi:MAG: hypothetical protein EA424_29505 [Planctomycetaceae bacterium]|nr:MAG: hypothetical protein EA424_29505 [Planctomycetaceae bacterium]